MRKKQNGYEKYELKNLAGVDPTRRGEAESCCWPRMQTRGGRGRLKQTLDWYLDGLGRKGQISLDASISPCWEKKNLVNFPCLKINGKWGTGRGNGRIRGFREGGSLFSHVLLVAEVEDHEAKLSRAAEEQTICGFSRKKENKGQWSSVCSWHKNKMFGGRTMIALLDGGRSGYMQCINGGGVTFRTIGPKGQSSGRGQSGGRAGF